MRKIAWLYCSLVLVLLGPSGWAKSYFHPWIEQTFEFEANGDAVVVEKRAFSFEGSFSWARLSIRRKGVADIVFQGVWDEETGEPCPFTVEDTPQEVAIRWSYQAEDTVRIFRIQYRLVGVVKCFQDVAEFYWKVIEDQHAQIGELRSAFFLPAQSSELFKLFVHTQAAPGEMVFSDDQRSVSFRLFQVPADTFVETRLLASPNVFPDVPLQEEPRYELILEEERRFAEAERISFQRGLVLLLLFGGLGMAYLVLFFLYAFRYGREPRLSYRREYEQEPPRLISPALLGVLLSQRKNFPLLVRAFLATILDLARRGFLTVHEEEQERRTFFSRRETLSFRFTEKGKDEKNWEKELSPFEAEVLSLLKAFRREDTDLVSTTDIEEWGKKLQGSKSNLLVFLEDWEQELRKTVEARDFPLLDKTSERKKNLFIGLGVGYLVAGFLVLVAGGSFFGPPVFLLVPMFFVVVLLMLLAWRFLPRWSPEAALEYRRWMAFRRFLTDFSLLKEASAKVLPLWDQYLVYAVVLGVAEKLLQHIKRSAQEKGASFSMPAWYVSTQGTAMGLGSLQGFTHLDALSRSIENMVNLGKALSTSTASGGGFSGGGGGGGGGGSSSAG